MAKTLLNGVNDILVKASVLDSDVGLLSTLTDSARQLFIDNAVLAINETLDHLYSFDGMVRPNQLSERTITLVTNDQDYALHADLVRLRREYGFIDETNNHIINIRGEDGYWDIIRGDIEQDDTGLPSFGAIRPTDGEFFLDRAPIADYNGRVYKYRFEKDLGLELAADTFPFSDPVYRALMPAATEMWKIHSHREFSEGLFNASLARAGRLLTKTSRRTTWQPRHAGTNPTDPMQP